MFNDLHSELTGEAGTAKKHSVILLRLAFRGYSQALQPRIGGLINEYVVRHNFMGSVLVADNGKVMFSKG